MRNAQTNGKQATQVAAGHVGAARKRLVFELRSMLFHEDEFHYQTGSTDGGDFIRIVHLPSAIERTAMRHESSREQLLDQVLSKIAENNETI